MFHLLTGCRGQKVTLGYSPPPVVLSHGDTPVLLLPPPCQMEQQRLSKATGVPKVLQGGTVRGTPHLLPLWSLLTRVSSITSITLHRGEIAASDAVTAPQPCPSVG